MRLGSATNRHFCLTTLTRASQAYVGAQCLTKTETVATSGGGETSDQSPSGCVIIGVVPRWPIPDVPQLNLHAFRARSVRPFCSTDHGKQAPEDSTH